MAISPLARLHPHSRVCRSGSRLYIQPVRESLYCTLLWVGAVVQLVEHWTRSREVAGSTHTRFTASNLEQVAILLCAQANSASYPQRDGK